MLEREADQPGPLVGIGIRDQVALGALTATYPSEFVDEVLAATGRIERRRRLLPARVMVYYALALALFAGVGYEEVMRCLVHGLGWARPRAGRSRRTWPAWHVPGASAIAEARARLGSEPLRVLFQRGVVPLATATTPGAWYRDWRVCAIDGTFHYEVRWILPVWVQGDPDRAADRLVVRQIPPSATWTPQVAHPEPPRILPSDDRARAEAAPSDPRQGRPRHRPPLTVLHGAVRSSLGPP